MTARDPVIMLDEPIPALRRVLQRAGMRMRAIDLYEVNEGFAPVRLAWLREMTVDSTSMAVQSRLVTRMAHPGPS